jgi:hypothetical protein
MLEYAKTILMKVSFDNLLFEKELRKARKVLEQEEEKRQLMQWCYEMFSKKHPLVLRNVYAEVQV